ELMKWEAAFITTIPANTFKDNTVITTLSDLSKLVNLISIGNYAFQNCTKITSADIPATVTTIGNSAFAGCNALTQFVVASANTAFKTVNGVLYNFAITELISYPNGKTSTSLNIPETVTSIRDYAFKGDNKLAVINAKTSTPATATTNSFDSVNKTTCKITVLTSAAITTYRAATGWSAFTTIEQFISIVTVNVATAGTLSSLLETDPLQITELNISGYLNGSDILLIRNMGINGSLAKLDIEGASIVTGGQPYYNSEVTAINTIGNYMFSSMVKLTRVYLPLTVTTIGNLAFQNCSLLTTVYCNILAVPSIGTTIFNGCSTLTKIWVASSSYGTYKSASGNWSSYSSLIDSTIEFADPVVLAKCVENGWIINTSGKMYASEAAAVTSFSKCFKGSAMTSFDELKFFRGVTSYSYVEFADCLQLTSATIPNTVTNTGPDSFSSCPNLVSLKFEDGNDSVPLSTGSSFVNNSKIATLVFPKRTVTINNYLNRELATLSKIYCKATTPPSLNLGYGDDMTVIDLFVPIGCYAVYAAATNWKSARSITEYNFTTNPHNVH
ncbi:MAG: leucine-rich repeat protein, partial [Bacteroidales bacterium]|nr:leucine-rich repeat protein [Bacteroidales bacterium]